MKTYAITSARFAGQILFKFGLKGNLIYFEIEAELSDVQLAWLYQRLPLTYPELVVFSKAPNSQMKLVEVPQDLSFAAFWKKYDHKVGKKDRAEKLWNAYSNAERAQILKSINAYDAYLARTGQNKAYPETYLSQKRHENEYK